MTDNKVAKCDAQENNHDSQRRKKTKIRVICIASIIAVILLGVFISKKIIDSKRLEELRKTHPQYFDVSNYGIKIYVLNCDEVRCILLPGPVVFYDTARLREEFKNAVSLDDMKLILSTYDIPDNNIIVEGYSDPLYSLYMGDNRGFIESIRKKLGLD